MRRLLAHTAVALFIGGAMLTPSAALADSQSSDSSVKPIDVSSLPSDLNGEIRRAQALRAQGKLDEAAHALGQMMLVEPDDAGVVSEYGKVLVLENRPDDAAAFLKRAIQLQGGDWTYYSALGVAYDEMGDNKSAKLAYQRALVFKPGEPAILNNYALSRMAAGDLVSARQIIAQAQAAGGNDPVIARNVALLMRSAPAPVASVEPKPVTAAKTTQAASVAAVSVKAPEKLVTAPLPPPAASPHGTGATNVAEATSPPRVLSKDVMMQAVPVDPLAGPVGKRSRHSKKPATPSLRMSADAS